jgi:hypothetical protein
MCAATGNYVTSGPNPQPVAGIWDGSRWTLEAIPHSHPELNLTGVACQSPTDCQAVGFALHSPLALGWNGSAWTVEPTPPAHTSKQFAAELAAVSTVPGGGFVAVGYTHSTDVLVERHG